MIAGRPTNLWLGLVGAVIGFGSTVAINVFHIDAVLVGNVAGPLGLLLGALIALVSNQPPTLAPGDTYTKATPSGTPNETIVVGPPQTTPDVTTPEATVPDDTSQPADPIDVAGGG